jgi:hypothetical protein
VHLREVSLLQFRVRTDGISGVRFRGKRALEEKKERHRLKSRKVKSGQE